MPTDFIGPTLTVDLSALADNYHRLRAMHTGSDCAAVVKANAYGLGVEAVSPALWNAGCRLFFVATLEEGVQLRALLPEARIGVFHGPYRGEEKEYIAHRLTPVLNAPGQLDRWGRALQDAKTLKNIPHSCKQDAIWRDAILHVDTGMNRLGFSQVEAAILAHDPEKVAMSGLSLVMSHLACADTPGHPANATQQERFSQVRALFPALPGSLANSAGILLDASFHHDVARPGCALYGIRPAEGRNPMRHVATLRAPLLQVHEMTVEDGVGYGSTYIAAPGSRIATAQIGYADGYARHLSNRARAYVAGVEVPLAGRVSMDMIMLDVSDVPPQALQAAGNAELINEHYTVNDLAGDAETIGYEVFTGLGARVKRVYV